MLYNLDKGELVMDENVRNSINARMDAIYQSYQVSEQDKLAVEELFSRINTFGESCKDVGEFENQFQTSSLNQEYMNLFTKIATRALNPLNNITAQGVTEGVVDEIAGSVINEAQVSANQQINDMLRDTPLGTLEQIANTKSLFKRFKK